MIEVQLWDEDGDELLKVVQDGTAPSGREARGETGSGKLTVPNTAEYRQLLARDLVVKHHLIGHGVVFAWRIEIDDIQPYGDKQSITVTGRGILADTEQGVLYPSRGLRKTSPDKRVFGFGAAGYGVDKLGGNWAAPQVREKTDNLPSGWPADPDGRRVIKKLWPTDPDANSPAGQQAWFYRLFSFINTITLRIDATGDDVVYVWLDGKQIIGQDGRDTQDPGSNKMTTYKARIAPGPHIITVRGEQIDAEDLVDLGLDPVPGNPAWVAVRIASAAVFADGSPLPNEDQWRCTFMRPGWTPGFVLRQLLTEPTERGVRYQGWTLSFTDTLDSNGQPWDNNVDRSWDVKTDTLKILTDLTETGVDIWATPDRTIHAALQRGVDRTDTVRLWPAKNLGSYGLRRRHKVSTVAVVHSEEGFTEVTDTAGLAAHGRRETGIDLADTESTQQAREQAATLLGPLAKQALETHGGDTEIITWAGATPKVDFDIGDIISVPDGGDGFMPAAVMAIAWSASTDGDQWALELDAALAGARTLSKTVQQRLYAVAASGGAASAGGRIQSATK